MNVNYPPTAITSLIIDIIDRITLARELSNATGVKRKLLDLYSEVEHELIGLKSTIESNHFSTEYTNQLARTLDKLAGAFPQSFGSGKRTPIVLAEIQIPLFKAQQERNEPEIEKALLLFKTTAVFFTKLDFLNRDLVIVGANGSGKTFLGNSLLKHVKNNGVIVSAQKILHLPEFDNVKIQVATTAELKKVQTADKTNKNFDFSGSQNEFGVLIQNLLADDIASHKEYTRNAKESAKKGMSIDAPRPTKLERTLAIWNSIFTYPQILYDDGMNIRAHTGSTSYSANEMSEGEKVTLFLIAQVLQSPENGFVIVDEPEMYLHPTIHKKLWDKLEAERPDAKFIYLTHDLEFASSRTHTKKLWLRSFQHPEDFELEEVPQNEIPQALLMELLGSRQDILFCEGAIGSLDEKIYGILFPNYVIKPVGGCLSVINFTKAFNKLPMSNRRAIGLVDGDYFPQQRLETLQQNHIFVLKVPDVENLLLDELILLKLQEELPGTEQQAEKTKEDILRKLKKERDSEIAKYISAKVDHYFKDTNVSMGKSLEVLKSNYNEFVEKVEIDQWARDRGTLIDNLLAERNYNGAIRIFKNKGLASIVNANFGIRDFTNRAIEFLQMDSNLRAELVKNFPEFKNPSV